jgi:hypothetical protein
MKTRKYKKYTKNVKTGGHIDKNNIFKYIVSIGYEVETADLVKFTLINVDGVPTLYHTDTAGRDYQVFREHPEYFTEGNEYSIIQKNEFTEIDVLDSNQNKNENIHFVVSNDTTGTPFIKYLETLCNETIDKDELYKYESNTGVSYPIHFVTVEVG